MPSAKPFIKRPQGRLVRPLLYTLGSAMALFAIAAGTQIALPGGGETVPEPVTIELQPPHSPSTGATSEPQSAAAQPPTEAIAPGPAPDSAPVPTVTQPTVAGAIAPSVAATGPSAQAVDSAPAAGPERSFLGVADSYRRVVIAFDVADSVRRKAEAAGVPLERVRAETAALVRALPPDTSFNLIQFVRRYDAFAEGPVPAIPANKDAALAWLEKRFRTDGRSGRGWTTGTPDGIELLLRRALAREPEVIFIISDGDFQRTRAGTKRGYEDVLWAALEEQVSRWQMENRRRVRIHLIAFGLPPGQRDAAARFTARFGGQLREIQLGK